MSLHPNSQSDADLVVSGGCIITMNSRRDVISDGAVAIRDGRIIAVGTTAEIAARYPSPNDQVDARGGVITPGFVEGHVHLSQHLGRSVLPDTWQESREHEHWLPYWQLISEEEAELSAILACMEMVQAGSTCFSDMSGRFTGELQASAARTVGIRGMVSETIWDLPPEPSVATGDTDECVARLESLLDRFPLRDDELIWAGVSLAGMGSASDELLQRAKELASSRGVVMSMHQSFAEADTAAYSEHAGGKTATQHFHDLGILGEDLHLVHMIRNSEAEIELLAQTGTSLVHCPAASLRWGLGVSRYGRIGQAVHAGVNVALGSDSGNYSDYLDIGKQMYLAATIHREASGVVPTIRAEDAMEMATINGARALGVADRIGSIEPGKQADLVVHSNQRAAWHPRYDAVRSLVYAAQSSAVETVIVAGEPVLRDGRFTRFDQVEMLERIDAAARRLTDRMGWKTPHDWPVHR